MDLRLAYKLDTAVSYKQREIDDGLRRVLKQETVRGMLEEVWLVENGENATIESIILILEELKLKQIVDEIKNNISN